MIKWFFILIRVIPRLIVCLIRCKHMGKHKDKYDLQTRYNEVKKMLHQLVIATRTTIEVQGKENLIKNHNNGRVYFINHASIFDAIVMIELIDTPLIFISKIENSKTPFLKTICTALDVLMMDRSSVRQSLRVCKEAGLEVASQNKDIVIFPEGTRSRDGNVKEFKAAFASIVHYSETETVMVSMTGTRGPLSWKWFKYPRNVIKVKVFEPIPYDFYKANKSTFNEHARKMMQSFIDENRNNA